MALAFPALTVLRYVILITGHISVFSAMGTTSLTPSLEEAVPVPAPQRCNLEAAVVCAQELICVRVCLMYRWSLAGWSL